MRTQPLLGAPGASSVCFQGGKNKLGKRAGCYSMGNNKKSVFSHFLWTAKKLAKYLESDFSHGHGVIGQVGMVLL